MTCHRCEGLGIVSNCILGEHCSCPDGSACGNATSTVCDCYAGIDAELIEALERAFQEDGAAVACAKTAKELEK